MKPYDACVANKWVNGSQIYVVWHVGDLKISNKDPQEVTNIIAYLKYIYGEMTIKRGRKNIYLGMDINLSDEGVEKIMHERIHW